MTVTADRGAAPPAPETRGRPTGKALQLLSWDRADLARARATILAGIAVCALGEAITAQSALLAFTRTAALAWLLAVAAVIAANLASWTAGSLWHSSRPAALGLAAAWAGVGATLFYLRISHSMLDTPPVSFGASADQLAANTATASASDQIQAWVMAALFVLGGALAAVKASTVSNPALLAHISAKEDAALARAARAAALSDYTQAASQHAKRLAEIDDVPTDLATQKLAIAHGIALAKHHARARIAELLAGPHLTGGVHTPATPTHGTSPGHPGSGGAPDRGAGA
ncbi:hypothetical protein [Sinomonas humi]|uniref:Uncharacterized protein n=1 Tax=Sinomonas humi TaxID=1338436 RepID=A0A0B2AEN3_9MICC|nr:hypothetical protein [Sinomonas humi]KHL00273.1 hypothetical protein LK10_20610 [Sinomonas humi]